MDQAKNVLGNSMVNYFINANEEVRMKDILILKLQKELKETQRTVKFLKKKNQMKDETLYLKEAELLMMKDHFSTEITKLKMEHSEKEDLKDKELNLLKNRIMLEEKSRSRTGKKLKTNDLTESHTLDQLEETTDSTEKLVNVTLRKNPKTNISLDY